jgi:hypothetical protein
MSDDEFDTRVSMATSGVMHQFAIGTSTVGSRAPKPGSRSTCPGTSSTAAASSNTSRPCPSEHLAQAATGEEDKIGFSIASGAYFLETNGGGESGAPALRADPEPRPRSRRRHLTFSRRLRHR